MANFFRVALSILFFIGSYSVAYAQAEVNSAPSNPPPSGPISSPPTSQSGISSEFQTWLKNNNNDAPAVANSPPPSLSPPPSNERNRPGRPKRFSAYPGDADEDVISSPPMSYEQEQKTILNSIPAGINPPSSDSNIAFNSMLQQNMPLAPQQVIQLRQQIDLAQRASATPPNIPPKPVSTTVMVNLAPGTTPPAIRLAQGYVSSLVFVDSTGSPWPIAAFDIGNPKSMNIQWDGKSNILLLQAVSPYSNGNIVVRLMSMPIPVTLELVTGQRVVDYRVDIHVSGIGPNTKDVPIGTQLPNSANQFLLGVLDGVAPPGSKPLTVQGADAQAWILGERIYFRTRFTVLSPGWIGTMASPDGMHAYEMPKTSSILVSRYGEPAEIKIEGL